MDLFEAIILGVIQGATEFLPVSSSGHLLLIPSLFNLEEPNLNAIAIAHQGTLLAVLIYFRRDLWRIITAVLKSLRNRDFPGSESARLGWYIAAGSVPAVIAGLTIEDLLDRVLTNPSIAALLLLLNAAILIVGELLIKATRGMDNMTLRDSLVIGIAQIFALLPGISRSGVTISTGLARGFDRSASARFSFLLGIPTIAGAGVLATMELLRAPDLGDQLLELSVTFLAAFIIGYLCIAFLLRWVRGHTLYIFSAYCALAGVFCLLIIWLR